MKVAILAGGKGIRMGEYTLNLPKPMVKVGGVPIVERIINHYRLYGYKDVYILGGYNCSAFREYFHEFIDVHIINTGDDTTTAGRLLMARNVFEADDDFLLTYGDGISDVNIDKVVALHKKKKADITMTVARARNPYGVVYTRPSGSRVDTFIEKPIMDDWVNAGFFVVKSSVLETIANYKPIIDVLSWEDILEKYTKTGRVYAYKHKGFWKSMDTAKDKEYLDNYYSLQKRV